MASKPTEKPNWVSDDGAAKIQEPTGSKKLTGFLKNERPPFNFLNWLFNILSHWRHYFAGNSQYNVIIDSDSDERDYATLAAYIADSPTAGDRVLVKIDEVLTVTLSIPSDIEITQLKGKKFTVATNFSPIIQFGNNVKTKGDFRIENSDTGTIAKGFSINGDNNHHDNLIIENKSTGTITDGVYIEVGAEGNYAQSRSINSGGGAITNDLTDNSGNDENHVTVKGDAAIYRSDGAKKFDTPELITPIIVDFTNAQHDHGDADDGGDLAFIPSGTKMAFFQAAAPTGWTQDTSQNDKALRVVSGSGGGNGGSLALSATTVGGHTLSESEMPTHNHTQNIRNVASDGNTSSRGGSSTNDQTDGNTENAGSSSSHNHGLALAYIDIIIATKD